MSTTHRRNAIESLESRHLLANILALNTSNQLIQFDVRADDPQFFNSVVDINGLGSNESIVSIDFRPATGELYGFSDAGQLYVVDPTTGNTNARGGPVSFFGDTPRIDFNPLVDLIRFTTNNGDNLRLSPVTGDVVGTDGGLTYSSGDAGTGTPTVVATAYDNNFTGTSQSALYAIDSATDTLITIGSDDGSTVSPNTGESFTVGDLGIDVIKRSAFDIAEIGGESVGYAFLQVSGELLPQLYEINLDTGNASLISPVQARLIQDMAVAPAATSAVILSGDNRIARFDTNAPFNFYAERAINGLDNDEQILSIDFRPADRVLYGVSNFGRVYVIDVANGDATAAGGDRIAEPVRGDRLTIDFNPTVDLIRFLTDEGQNWRIQPNDGTLVAVDGDVNSSDARPPIIVAGAYSNNLATSDSTVLYNVDVARNVLTRQGQGDVGPNTGTQFDVGPLGITPVEVANAALDIYTLEGVDYAWGVFRTQGEPDQGTTDDFYRVNLLTGAVTFVGNFVPFAGTDGDVLGIAFDPRP